MFSLRHQLIGLQEVFCKRVIMQLLNQEASQLPLVFAPGFNNTVHSMRRGNNHHNPARLRVVHTTRGYG